MRLWTGIPILLLAALTVAGCGDDTNDEGQSPAEKPAAEAPKGKVRFVTPKDGAKTGETVRVKVALEDFNISAKTVGQAPRPGQGHLHFTLDDGKFDVPKYSGKNGQLGKKLGVAGKYSPALAPTITYKGLPKGKHELKVDLANNNHTNVGVDAKVSFTVK
jgi:hypothetical protein